MYSYENYQKVKAEIEKRRLDAIASAEARSEMLRLESAQIKEIDEELSSTGLLIFKTACSGGDITPIKERNKSLNKQRVKIIKSLGYPEDYTEVKYHCKKCSDTGYIDGVKMCKCLKEELIKATIASSGIGDLISEQSFDNFDLSLYEEGTERDRMTANLARAKQYARDFSKKRSNLLFVGTTGTGKTHLSTAIAREVIHMGYDVLYDSIHNIVSDFEADKFKSGYGQLEQKSEKYLECDLLIIDDLGTEFSNQFTVSCIYNLLNTRQNHGKATIISTNLSPEELSAKYEGRIYSRLVGKDTTVLMFVGKDRRLYR
ncbi:MAG: ATP-binding protein [Clostridia bacterium]|nr:ATP-binding protein [Clostridia bacterium]